jgi:hypothetical protein
MRNVQKSEIVVTVIAVLALAVTVVGHLAGASIANSSSFGIIAAPVPLVLFIIAFAAYTYAASHDEDSNH